MIDREKVIEGLHCCSHTDGVNCIKCPYNLSDSDCTALMSMDVLELLKEQESTLNLLRSTMEDMVRGNASEEVSYLLRLLDKWK